MTPDEREALVERMADAAADAYMDNEWVTFTAAMRAAIRAALAVAEPVVREDEREDRRAEDDEVEKLREALRDLYHEYVRTLGVSDQQIIDFGGDCDSIGVMEKSDRHLASALAAIRASAVEVE